MRNELLTAFFNLVDSCKSGWCGDSRGDIFVRRALAMVPRWRWNIAAVCLLREVLNGFTISDSARSGDCDWIKIHSMMLQSQLHESKRLCGDQLVQRGGE